MLLLGYLVDGDHNTDLEVGCARDYALFLAVAMQEEHTYKTDLHAGWT